MYSGLAADVFWAGSWCILRELSMSFALAIDVILAGLTADVFWAGSSLLFLSHFFPHNFINCILV